MGGFALGVLVGGFGWALFDTYTANESVARWKGATVHSCDDIAVFVDDCKRAMRMARDDLSIWSEDADAYHAELVGIIPFRYREGLAPGFEIKLDWHRTTYEYRAEGQSVYRVGFTRPDGCTVQLTGPMQCP